MELLITWPALIQGAMVFMAGFSAMVLWIFYWANS